jgi:hypothetical protein
MGRNKLRTKITLVASQNGLGHSRRLAVLGISMKKLGVDPTLVATEKQIHQLQVEFGGQDARLLYFEANEQFELDGPALGESGVGRTSHPSTELISLVSKSDICVSDNLIWPAKFATRFVLLANFLWSDYWRLRAGPTPSVLFQEGLEKSSAAYISERYSNVDLLFSHNDQIRVTSPYRFIRYPRDDLSTQLSLGPSIWISGGTTGLFKTRRMLSRKSHQLQKVDFVDRETWRFGSKETLPWAVVGRPGLGTIRDCMAAGIPFFPDGYDLEDPELKKNAEFVRNFFELEGLANIWELGERQLQALRDKFEKNRSYFLQKWNDNSESPDNLLSRML